jgi:hypothetical protein
LRTEAVIAKAAGTGKRDVTSRASLGLLSLEPHLRGRVESQQT